MVDDTLRDRIEELEAKDLELRQESYALEEKYQAAFVRYVAPIREKKREVNAERGGISRELAALRKDEDTQFVGRAG